MGGKERFDTKVSVDTRIRKPEKLSGETPTLSVLFEAADRLMANLESEVGTSPEFETHPRVSALESAKESARFAAGSARSRHYPTLDLTAKSTFEYPNGPQIEHFNQNAVGVALNITWTAFHLIRRSVDGLMDASLPLEEQKAIEAVLAQYRETGIQFHALLTRQAASRRFISVHVLVPGEMTVHDAHHIAEDIETDIRKAVPDSVVITHLEPQDDEISMDDISLDRE